MNEKLDLFIDMTNDRLARIEGKLDVAHDKLEDVQKFRWRSEGGRMMLTAIVSALTAIVAIVLGR